MKNFITGTCILGVALAVQTQAFADFLPPNNLHLEDNLFRRMGGITEEQFNNVIDKATEIYAPIAENHGAGFEILRLWDDSTVNAYADRSGDKWVVGMFGGLARRPEVTVDGFTLVVCHEIGHHVGGFPFKSRRWASAEGQADYFATLSCGRIFWGAEKEENAKFRKTIDAFPKSLCDKNYKDVDDQNLCYRQMMAGLSLANLLANLGGSGEIRFDSPDDAVVSRTYENHPDGQCRLDTYVAGAICTKSWDDNLIPKSEDESANYTCNMAQGFQREARPRCWFKPNLPTNLY
ncbi:MAG: hypothetical protein AB7T49_04615 [Oligoflexales bacterium]